MKPIGYFVPGGFTVVGVMLLFVTGCATMENVSVNMVNVQFRDATVFESTATFTLRINNESPETLVLDGGVHKIYLNGIYVGEGLSNQRVEIQRLSSVAQPVEVHLSNLRLATRIRPIIEARAFDYRISSTLYASRPHARTHIVTEGRLDLHEFQPTPP